MQYYITVKKIIYIFMELFNMMDLNVLHAKAIYAIFAKEVQILIQIVAPQVEHIELFHMMLYILLMKMMKIIIIVMEKIMIFGMYFQNFFCLFILLFIQLVLFLIIYIIANFIQVKKIKKEPIILEKIVKPLSLILL